MSASLSGPVRALLLASLLLNAVLAGSVFALWQRSAEPEARPAEERSERWRGRSGHAHAGRHLTEAERALMREVFKQHRPAIGERVHGTRAARAEVGAALRARPYDPARLEAAFATLRMHEGQTAEAAHRVMLELAGRLDDAGRERLAEGMERRGPGGRESGMGNRESSEASRGDM